MNFNHEKPKKKHPVDKESSNYRNSRDRHFFDSYAEWLSYHNVNLCLECLKVSKDKHNRFASDCGHKNVYLQLSVKDRIPKKNASLSRWREFFKYKKILFCHKDEENVIITPLEATEIVRDERNTNAKRKRIFRK